MGLCPVIVVLHVIRVLCLVRGSLDGPRHRAREISRPVNGRHCTHCVITASHGVVCRECQHGFNARSRDTLSHYQIGSVDKGEGRGQFSIRPSTRESVFIDS